MARMPGAIWKGEQSPRVLMSRWDAFCIHTIVGFAPAEAAHFSTTGDGDIIQSRDTLYRSGANLNGNHRVIASENEDHGPRFPAWNTRDGHAVPALTDEQVEANGLIARFLHDEHGIPLQLCPNSRPESRGLAYHRQGIDGNFLTDGYAFPGCVPGGEVWTTSPGKVCPGDRRIAQLPDILRIARGEDMALSAEDKQWLIAAIDARFEVFGKVAGDLIKLDHDGDPDTAKLSLERVLRTRPAVDSVALAAVIDKAVRDALAASVVTVDVNVKGTPA